MAKPKRKTLLQSQREKLARQRAARRAAQRAARDLATSNRRSLPPRGRTTATSPRARVQRGLTRDRLAKQQLQNFGRALQRTMKQRQAQNKLDQAARGTKSSQTRTAGGAGQLARRGGGSSSPTSQRIQPVRVRVEGQKQLPGAKKPAGQLPAKTTQKTQPTGQPSARRAQAAAQQVRAAQGTTGPNRVGQPPGAANRVYGASRVNKAVSRAQLSSNLQKIKGRGGLLGTALMAATGAAASSGLLGKKVQNSVNEFGNRTEQVLKPGFFSGGNNSEKKGTGRGKPIRNRRGRIVGYEPVKPARRGMADIRGTSKDYKADEARLAAAARPAAKPAKTQPTVKGTQQPPASKPVKKPVRKPKLSGIGPFKSGEGYATAVTGKSKTQRDAEELRRMQERSRARQAAQRKKKK